MQFRLSSDINACGRLKHVKLRFADVGQNHPTARLYAETLPRTAWVDPEADRLFGSSARHSPAADSAGRVRSGCNSVEQPLLAHALRYDRFLTVSARSSSPSCLLLKESVCAVSTRANLNHRLDATWKGRRFFISSLVRRGRQTRRPRNGRTAKTMRVRRSTSAISTLRA